LTTDLTRTGHVEDPAHTVRGGLSSEEPSEAPPEDPAVDHADSRSGGRDGSEGAKHRRRSSWRLFAVGAVFVGAMCFLIVKGLSGSLDYFETVDQAVVHKAMLGSRTFRLEGLVVPGTVHRTASGVTFLAAGSEHRVVVTNTGNPPQLFQPDIPVVVVGHFAGATFVSDQIIVDHTAQYVEEHPQRVEAPNGTRR
jgi:cytochrome c-type biogenesis protein CcmE